jgi:hypothetical protein
MIGKIELLDKEYPIYGAKLHIPLRDDNRWIYLMTHAKPNCGFAFWGAEIPGLERIEDLDGQPIHVKRSGEVYDDDTLATDIIGMDEESELNYWNMMNEVCGPCYFYGEIRIDFKRQKDLEFLCMVECRLTDKQDVELIPENCPVIGRAEFVVAVDEQDPFLRSIS